MSERAQKVVDAMLDEYTLRSGAAPARAHVGDNDDEEIANAARQPFTALDYALNSGRHHPKLWQAIKGSPFEREYRNAYNPTD